jgi:plasmid stabilization system protein ParE
MPHSEFELLFADSAEKRLIDLVYFLIQENKVPEQKVKEFIRKLLDKTTLLKANPYIGQKELYLAHLNLGHRRLVFKNVKIVYRVDGKRIIVTDFFDSRQDPRKMNS